jgi:molecular chaperone GrpE
MNKHPKDEIVDFEPEEELATEAAAKAKLGKLRAELETVRKERQEYLDGWQRCKADAVNSRKDVLRDAERTAERKLEALIEDILPALDSFDIAAASESWAEVSDGWRSGMEQVQSQLLEALRQHGVERTGSVGEVYNPRLHEAIEERDDVAGDKGQVARIIRYGYVRGERIIRPAHVIVKK